MFRVAVVNSQTWPENVNNELNDDIIYAAFDFMARKQDYHCLGEDSSLTHKFPNINRMHRIRVSQHAVNEAPPVNVEERHRIQ